MMLERSFAGFILVLLAIFYWEQRNLSWTTSSGAPAGGFFPALVLGLMLVVSVTQIVLVSVRATEINIEESARTRDTLTRQASYLAVLVVTMMLVPSLGLLGAIFMVVVGLRVVVDRAPIVPSVFLGVGFVVSFYFLFDVVLGLRIPYGRIGELVT